MSGGRRGTGERRERDRFPASVYDHGSEPDARFSLANERTFLAWIRTSLALMAGGVAVQAVRLDLPWAVSLAASLALLAAGVLAAAQAWFGWVRTERALRRRAPLPASRAALPVGVVVVLVGIAVLVALAVPRGVR